MNSGPSTSRGRLCFFVPQLYPIAVGGEIELAGGIEVQEWARARAFATQGFDVSVATCDYGQAEVERRDGVALLRAYDPQAGVPGIRFFYPRLWRTVRTLRAANADVYLASGAGLAAGWAYDAARLSGARFVFLAASDKDVYRSLPGLPRRREKWWYLRAIRGADACVAQTQLQRRLFLDNFGIEAPVVPYGVEIPSVPTDVGTRDTVLWLSTYKPTKRPEWFVEAARRLPQLRFRMIGYPPEGEANPSWQAARRAASELANLSVQGFVAHSEIGSILEQTALFVHTSPLEGFPNTLLEAWSFGVPCVTAVDPDGVVEQHGLGEVVDSVDSLAAAVAELMAAPERRRELGRRAREYVVWNHSPASAHAPLIALLDRLLESRA